MVVLPMKPAECCRLSPERCAQVGAGGCALQQEWQAHSLETWCATFDPGQPHLVYSGSDDCSFKGWDLRQEQPSPVFVNSKSHGAGVCIVSPHPSRTQLLATGSYDECIRLWDARNMARPLVAAERAAGGGVWRLKWHPADPHLLLAACMYGGFAVARCATAFDSVEVVETYVAHGSIAYGADWFQGAQLPAWAAERAAAAAGGAGRVEDGCGRSMVATCSFYDKLLHVWLPKTTAEMTAVATSARPPSA